MRRYTAHGFSDPTLSGLDALSAPALAAYARGAASLIRLPDPRLVATMIGAFEPVAVATPSMLHELSRRAAHLRQVGRAAMRIFFDLECRIHAALGRPAPAEERAAPTIRAMFGDLPSRYSSDLGLDPPSAPGEQRSS